jgi:hypothetical protein
VADAYGRGDDDLEVRLSWPEHQVGPPEPARVADRHAGEGTTVEPYLAHVDHLRHEVDAELRRQLARFRSLSDVASEREQRIASALGAATKALADATAGSLDQVRVEATEQRRQLEEQGAAQHADFTRLAEMAQREFKAMFTDHVGELDRLLRESHHELNAVVEQHVAEIERSLSSSTTELNEVADQRFAEIDRMVESKVDAIQQATARSLTDIETVVDRRFDRLEERVVSWAQERNSANAARVAALTRHARASARFATIALAVAVIAIGVAVAALLSGS